jgi:hypothetical protein
MKRVNKLIGINETIDLIKTGKNLVISGHESLLKKLPKGNWIGATLSRFMDVSGGVICDDKLFVCDLSTDIEDFNIKLYNESNITDIVRDSYDNGFSYILLPLYSKVHAQYGISAFGMKNLYTNPLVGWVAGINPNDEGKLTPQVFMGQQGLMTNENAVVMHCKLSKNKVARLEIVNVFTQGDGDKIEFTDTAFAIKDCYINGKLQNLASYWTNNHIDERLPLMANMAGAQINVHPLSIDEAKGIVHLAAAVFPGFTYRLAKPIDDYIKAFKSKVPTDIENIVSSVNCHANFEYLKLEGHTLGGLRGPFAIGEIGYILLNQTMVNLIVENYV